MAFVTWKVSSLNNPNYRSDLEMNMDLWVAKDMWQSLRGTSDLQPNFIPVISDPRMMMVVKYVCYYKERQDYSMLIGYKIKTFARSYDTKIDFVNILRVCSNVTAS